MDKTKTLAAAVTCYFAIPALLPAQQLKPETVRDYECYLHGAEARMATRKAFLMADADPALKAQLLHGDTVQTIPGNGANPHKIQGAMVYDWIGAIFIPGVSLDRAIRMLQDYDHRALYFTEIVGSSKLLCRTGEDRFGYAMRLKEPVAADTENDVVWERVDPHRWRCRSYGIKVQEIGKPHRYLLGLNSYWRLAETDKGVYVEAQTITLSGEFSSFTRALGSMVGLNPEKSLKKTLESMRDSLLKPGLEFAKPPAGLPICGAPVPAPSCNTVSSR
jgi:hypothetical protein